MEKEQDKTKTFKQPGQKDWANPKETEISLALEKQSRELSALFTKGV